MDDQLVREKLRELVDAASTRALGWILEQHCWMRLAGTTLEVFFIGNHRIAWELLRDEQTIKVVKRLAANVFGNDVNVRIYTDVDIPDDLPARRTGAMISGFDIEGLLKFNPARFWCRKGFALWKTPSAECISYNHRALWDCDICKVRYIPTDQYDFTG
jgi:hypothetical protein